MLRVSPTCSASWSCSPDGQPTPHQHWLSGVGPRWKSGGLGRWGCGGGIGQQGGELDDRVPVRWPPGFPALSGLVPRFSQERIYKLMFSPNLHYRDGASKKFSRKTVNSSQFWGFFFFYSRFSESAWPSKLPSQGPT